MRGTIRAARSIVAAAFATLLAVSSIFAGSVAHAHQEIAIYALAVIDEVTPAVDGLDIRVAELTAPVVIATNRTNEPFVVEGVDGEAFLRLHKGRVEANLNSPTAYRAADPTGDRPLPKGLDADKAPRWSPLARKSTWSWFDPRIEYVRGEHNAWTIPATIGGRPVTIKGGFEAMEGHGHFQTELDSAPNEAGLEIRMFDGSVPGMLARNTSSKLLLIPGRQGEPFLKIGPRGVFGNERSPDFYVSGSQTIRKVPPDADPAAPPEWVRLSGEPVWSWLEHRARLPATVGHRSALGTTRHTVLSWTTPLTFGAKDLEISGHVEWIPPRVAAAPDPSQSLLDRWGPPLLLALLVGAVVLVILRLRPRPLEDRETRIDGQSP